jgi:hypothetical protein
VMRFKSAERQVTGPLWLPPGDPLNGYNPLPLAVPRIDDRPRGLVEPDSPIPSTYRLYMQRMWPHRPNPPGVTTTMLA